MYAKVRVPGSCGELVQGLWKDYNLLISCPINRYSEASVTIRSDSNEIIGTANKTKALKAVKKVLNMFNCPFGALVEISSQLIPGKGLASSTADIAAAAWATGLALGTILSEKQIADIALSIEPSDGVFYQGLALFDYLQGRIQTPLGCPPSMGLLTVDLGGMVDTIAFNQDPDLPKKKLLNKKNTEQAFKLATEGIREKSLVKIGQASTLSALANQAILPKQKLEELIEIVLYKGGYGVVVAHSGTTIGIMMDIEDDFVKWQQIIQKRIEGRILYPNTKVIGGGFEIIAEGEQRKGRLSYVR
jgi:L-threonine kinase